MIKRPLIMGILNLTPDSFYDGGKGSFLARAAALAEQDADIIDLGGESTRPGAQTLSAQEEAGRVIPVLIQLRSQMPQKIFSIDTYKPTTALSAAKAGVNIINDPSGAADIEVLRVAADYGLKYVLMHMRGTPQTMNTLAVYTDIIAEIKQFFEEKIDTCLSAGIKRENIILDPGFGFAKNTEQNWTVLNNFAEFKTYGLPLLAGLSRKRFLGGDEPESRLASTLEANKTAVKNGADIIRVHDVAPHIKLFN